MNCNKKTRNTCGTTNYATCIYYELNTPNFSKIEGDCPTIEDTTGDIYLLIKELREQIDLSGLGNRCLQYTIEGGEINVKNALDKIEEKICEIEERVQNLETTAICDMPIGDCVNLGTLKDDCDVTPTTFGEILQILVNKNQ